MLNTSSGWTPRNEIERRFLLGRLVALVSTPPLMTPGSRDKFGTRELLEVVKMRRRMMMTTEVEVLLVLEANTWLLQIKRRWTRLEGRSVSPLYDHPTRTQPFLTQSTSITRIVYWQSQGARSRTSKGVLGWPPPSPWLSCMLKRPWGCSQLRNACHQKTRTKSPLRFSLMKFSLKMWRRRSFFLPTFPLGFWMDARN